MHRTRRWLSYLLVSVAFVLGVVAVVLLVLSYRHVEHLRTYPAGFREQTAAQWFAGCSFGLLCLYALAEADEHGRHGALRAPVPDRSSGQDG